MRACVHVHTWTWECVTAMGKHSKPIWLRHIWYQMDHNPHEYKGLNAIILTFYPSRWSQQTFWAKGIKKKSTKNTSVCSQRELDEAPLQRLNVLFVEPNVEKAAFCFTWCSRGADSLSVPRVAVWTSSSWDLQDGCRSLTRCHKDSLLCCVASTPLSLTDSSSRDKVYLTSSRWSDLNIYDPFELI